MAMAKAMVNATLSLRNVYDLPTVALSGSRSRVESIDGRLEGGRKEYPVSD